MGRLYWITGLAGAGKSSLSRRLYEALKPQSATLVYLDGDSLRKVLNATGQYEEFQRYQLAMKYARLCQLLTAQGVDVICATISMFDEVRGWNRKNIPEYTEIYLETPISVLKQRNKNGLYTNSQKIRNVVGLDITAQLPKHPDIILRNDGERTIDELTVCLLELI